jgi:hypothetical protein
MSEAQLKSGMEWLLNRVYSPHAFGQRVQAFAETYRTRVGRITAAPLFAGIEAPLARRLAQYGKEEQNLLRLLQQISLKRPDLRSQLGTIFIYYCQFRHILEYNRIWNPQLSHQDAPVAA